MRGFGARSLALAVLALFTWGCAGSFAYRQGRKEARKGNWDMAVAHLTKALTKDPGNIQYRIGLERARAEASRAHYDKAKKHLAADELDEAADELDIATKYDTGNDKAAEALRVAKERIKKREDQKKKAAELEQAKTRARSRTVVPVLSPRSPVPLTLKFPNASLEKVFETLSKLSGVNILFDESFKDKTVNVTLNDVTFEEALDQLTFTNRLFYKVLDGKTLLIIPDTAQKRRTYEDVLVRTFYLENADPNETLNLVKNLTGVTKAAVNASLGALTILGTFDELAMAERIVDTNDKPRGEVVVELEILEVDRTLLKQYGLELSEYQASTQLAPISDDAAAFTRVRAHLLSSLNLSDFIVKIPSTILTKFLQSDANTRILAAPRLRAAEGKKTTLVIGSQIPVPTTTFQSTSGIPGQVFSPTTSFQYRDVGVKLDLTPKITATGDITLEIAVEFSLQGENVSFTAGQIQPTFLTRSVTGILRLKDGQTTLLGGLIQSQDQETLKGVAGLQGVPVLGSLFNSHDKTRRESEVLISITPRLVRGPELSEDDFTALYVGSKENIRVPSARPPLFGPPEEEEKKPEAPASPPPPALEPPGTVPEPEPGKSSSGAAVAPRPAQGIAAMLTPPRPRLVVGEAKNIDVVLTSAVKALAVELVLVYDAKVLEATSVNAGSLLTLDGTAINAERSLDLGRVRATFRRATPASGSGVVASVAFKALQPGSTPVTIESMKVITEAGEEAVRAAGVARVTVAAAEDHQEEKP